MTFCIQRNVLKRVAFLEIVNKSSRFLNFSSRGLPLLGLVEQRNEFSSVKKTVKPNDVPIYYNAIRQFSSTQTNESEQNVDSKKKTLEGGVIIVDTTLGSGTLAKSGKTITVYYSGKLKSSNKVFDEVKEGSGLTFRLGRGEVINGWDVGVAGMKVGGKRIITCPPAMAYGAKGYPPVIPPNSTLVFEVELKKVE